MSHHKNIYQINHRIKRLITTLNDLVQATAADADQKGGQYYRGRAQGVLTVAEAVIHELGPVVEEPAPTEDRDCPRCEAQRQFKVIQTVPDNGLPGSLYGCMICGWEDQLTR